MLFAADIGNSCIDIGLFDEAGNLKMKSKISSVGSRTVDEYTVVISGLLAANGFLPDAITDGIVSSVVPGLTAVIKSAVKKLSDISFPLTLEKEEIIIVCQYQELAMVLTIVVIVL